MAHTSRITGAAAREHVRVAELLDAHPEAADLLATGAVTWAHARVVATTLESIDKLGTVDQETRVRAVEFLSGQARTLDPVSLSFAGQALVEALTTTPDVDDPDETAAVLREASEKPADRFIQITRNADGTSRGRWRGLDPVSTAALEAFFHHAALSDQEQGPGSDTGTGMVTESPWEAGVPGNRHTSNPDGADPCRDRRT